MFTAVMLFLVVAVIFADVSVIVYLARCLAVRLGMGELLRLVLGLVGSVGVLAAALPTFYLGGWIGWGTAAVLREWLHLPGFAVIATGLFLWMILGGGVALIFGIAVQAVVAATVYFAGRLTRA